MKTPISAQLVYRLGLWSVLALILLACNPATPATEPQEEGPAPADTSAPTAVPTAAPTSPPTAAPTLEPETVATSEQDESQDAPADELFACPTESSTYWLLLTHGFWTDTGRGKWQWEANGAVPLYVEGDGTVTTNPLAIVAGRQFGQFSVGDGGCTFTAPAEISLSVSGTCSDGWLTLELWEYWDMGTYEWQCDDDGFQFDLPPSDPANHPNLKFPLTGGESYVEYPWLGGQGSKQWSLLMTEPEIDTVPLTEP